MLAEEPFGPPLDPALAPVRDLPIIAHLASRWDPAWHTPHRLLRALATQAPVLLVEEPAVLEDVRRERLDVADVAPGLVRALPRLPGYLREYDRAAATVRAMLQDAMRPDGTLGGRFAGAVQWFANATPSGEFLDALGEVGVVYDCLATPLASAGAEPGARERALLGRADLVLAAGDRATTVEGLHRVVLRVDAAVDLARWSDASASAPLDVAALPRPIFGYVGPVDDRLDHALLRALRVAAPGGSIVLVGPPGRPPVDGEPATPLPDGVRWLGVRDESLLPAYVRAFDACIFPLSAARSDVASDPPAILECLVAGRPVIASVAPHLPGTLDTLVQVASSPADFAAVAMAAATPDAVAAAESRRDAVHAAVVAAEATWDQVATRVRGALFEAIAARPMPMNAIADALIAGRGLPPGAASGAR
jgi:hypothetical protein